MLSITLVGAAKRFQYEWIFKNIDWSIAAQSKVAVTGSNGSGKSTLLKCIAGLMPLTDGKVSYHVDQQKLAEQDFFKHLSISAPYLELPEEFTLGELLDFHFKFKKKVNSLSKEDMLELLYMKEAKNKQIHYFSSGMKQRLKLGLCFFSQAPLLLLDEPTSNLDQKGIEWYQRMVADFGREKTILVCSNDPREYVFCEKTIHMDDFKLKASI